jgi:hypothetical protein
MIIPHWLLQNEALGLTLASCASRQHEGTMGLHHHGSICFSTVICSFMCGGLCRSSASTSTRGST